MKRSIKHHANQLATARFKTVQYPATDAMIDEMSGLVEQIVRELRAKLDVEYGDRLVKTMVYGSEARGDAEPDSDIDVLIVLKEPVDVGIEIARLSQFRSDLCLRHGRVVSCLFMDEERFLKSNGPLLRNVRREGVAV